MKQPPSPAPGLLGLLSALLGLCLIACHACGPGATEVRSAYLEASQLAAQAGESGLLAAERHHVAGAVDAARPLVHSALGGFQGDGESARHATCAAMNRREEHAEALACTDDAMAVGFRGASILSDRVDALLGLARYGDARDVLFQLRDLGGLDDGLSERILASFTSDPLFLRPVVTLESGVHVDQIRSLGGGSTITLKLKLNDVNVAAFKPHQTRLQSNYRAEVAAFRLCPIIRCGFEVPYSFEARIGRHDFMRMYRIRSLDAEYLATHEGYARHFVDLVWRTDDDGSFLYGVWKDWVPHFTQFPIEYDDVWDSWVSVNGDATELEQPLIEALAPLRGREMVRWSELVEESGDTITRDLARQISNMLAFDFMINNWDRFSTAFWGVNCQFASGQFVSIDNGAGFQTREPNTAREHLHQATRFSRSLVTEVRLLDHDSLLPVLFPDASPREVERFDGFWQRREEFLQYVDGLIETHGEDAVLFFE